MFESVLETPLFMFYLPHIAVDCLLNVKIVRQILHGVDYLHQQGLLHRDLKVTMQRCIPSTVKPLRLQAKRCTLDY